MLTASLGTRKPRGGMETTTRVLSLGSRKAKTSPISQAGSFDADGPSPWSAARDEKGNRAAAASITPQTKGRNWGVFMARSFRPFVLSIPLGGQDFWPRMTIFFPEPRQERKARRRARPGAPPASTTYPTRSPPTAPDSKAQHLPL